MTESNTQNSNITLFGEVTITGKTENGEIAEVVISQIRVRDYPRAINAVGNEMELLKICSKVQKQINDEWKPAKIEELHPTTYDAAAKSLQALNADGFFSFVARQVERATMNMKPIPAEVIENILSRKLSQGSLPNAS